MKKLIVSSLVLLMSSAAFAKSVYPSSPKISPSSIDTVYRLVDKPNPGSSHKKLSIITTDGGMSTDVSPRYSIYLGYASMAEMGNIQADFKITDKAFQIIGAKRLDSGIYEVQYLEYRDEGMLKVTQVIDATAMFSEENRQRKACGSDFCDIRLSKPVEVTETAVPAY